MWIAFASEEDIPAIILMEKECFGERAWTKDMIENDFNNRSLYVVCKNDLDDDYLGYLALLDLESECELLRIGIRKQYRHKGYARILLDFLLEYCRDSNKEKIYLEVNSKNVTAIKLYKNFGFSQLNVRKNYYGVGADAINYVKLL